MKVVVRLRLMVPGKTIKWLLLSSLVWSFFLNGEEVIELIDDAKQKYSSGSFVDAWKAINDANQAVIGDITNQLTSFLPNEVKDWERKHAREIHPKEIGANGFGVSAFYKDKQNHQVRISIMGDSPQLDSAVMISKDKVFAEISGMTLEDFSGRTAILYMKGDEGKRGSVRVLIGQSAVVTIEGWGLEIEDLKAWAGKINYSLLASFFGTE